MIEAITTLLFGVLLVLPFVSMASAYYLVRLASDTVSPPVLLVLLTVQAIVTLVSATYLSTLRILTGVFGIVLPPALLPFTLLFIIAPLIMVNVIAFMLWRQRGQKAVQEAKESSQDELDAAREVKKDRQDAAREVKRDKDDAKREDVKDVTDEVREEQHKEKVEEDHA